MGKNKIHSKVVFSVAQKIRRHREALKFSQEEFADHIQLDRSTMVQSKEANVISLFSHWHESQMGWPLK
jgi:DNA-binding XRE family transcriptional regulator